MSANDFSCMNHWKQRICDNFNKEGIASRLQTLQVKTLDHPPVHAPRTHYAKTSPVPAYYDPNIHTIFLNASLIQTLSPELREAIYCHELIHAASFHEASRNNDWQLFQSGLKIESFGPYQTYSCIRRQLNEGIVQYFTLALTNHWNKTSAYHREVAMIRRTSVTLGLRAYEIALFDGTIDLLQDQFDTCYGANTFDRFAGLLDRKNFHGAHAIIQNPRLVTLPRSLRDVYQAVT